VPALGAAQHGVLGEERDVAVWVGLAIVAVLVAAHGGSTWVRSRPGEGATFSIALPPSEDDLAGSSEEDTEEPDAGDAEALSVEERAQQHAHGSIG
jgi:hypothetical protein